MEARPVVPVVCALIEDAQGRVLLARRPKTKHLGDLWEFPGGKVEPGETNEKALHREIAEELGCTILVSEALTEVVHAYETVTIRLLPYFARLAPGSPLPSAHEHSALCWVGPTEIDKLALPAADAPIVKEWRARRAEETPPATLAES